MRGDYCALFTCTDGFEILAMNYTIILVRDVPNLILIFNFSTYMPLIFFIIFVFVVFLSHPYVKYGRFRLVLLLSIIITTEGIYGILLTQPISGTGLFLYQISLTKRPIQTITFKDIQTQHSYKQIAKV